MQCLNNSDIKSSKMLTVWNIKLIMVYYWTYCKTLTFPMNHLYFFSNTLEFLSSNLLVPWLEILSGESHNNNVKQNINDEICIFTLCLCSLCGYECLCFSLPLFFPFTYHSYDLYWRI